MSSNLNMQHIGEYRLDIFTGTLTRCKPEFFGKESTAKKRMKELRRDGNLVSFFVVSKTGELISA